MRSLSITFSLFILKPRVAEKESKILKIVPSERISDPMLASSDTKSLHLPNFKKAFSNHFFIERIIQSRERLIWNYTGSYCIKTYFSTKAVRQMDLSQCFDNHF